MKFLLPFSFLFFSILVSAQTRFDVTSGIEFNTAQNQATAGDTIVWLSGTYRDTRMDLNTDGIIVTAQPIGTVLFTGSSRVVINSDNVTFSGFQYIGGSIGSLDIITVNGSDVLITEVNIQNYTCHKYLRVFEESKRTTISYCNFENRLNLIDQNILSILVDNEPGFHKIQYCSFKNFDGFGNDQGIEPIRIGVSSQLDRDSRTLVEFCYFTQCNGDGEIISHKARQNVYRYNTFEDNPVAELVLRHGDESIVYGNFFLNNMGGIRVREASNHFIYNNYFEGMDRRSIFLQNESSDPLSDIHIYHNTIVDSEEILLGSSGGNQPADVFIANNVFTDPKDRLFTQDTENETWINNFWFGNLGIDVPPTGLTNTEPELSENTEGLFQPSSSSPVISAAGDGFPEIPLFPGMDYDNEILLDLMMQPRPASITDRAIGASEFSSTIEVQPHVNELNTGPAYLFDNLVDYLTANATQLNVGSEADSRSIMVTSNIDWEVMSDSEWLSADLSSGSGDSQLNLTIDENQVNVNRSAMLTISSEAQSVTIIVNQEAGDLVSVFENLESKVILFPNPTDGIVKLSNLPSGSFNSLIEVIDIDGRSVLSKEYPIDNNELLLNIENLASGAYLLNIKLMSQSGTVHAELTRKVVRN